jgi:hypothetical protein
MKLYSYTLHYDDGAAPNPFWGICTLAIRKPAVRLAAELDDWIVGLGSANSPIGDISKQVVYAMKVTGKMTLLEYDQFCKTFIPKKKPDWRNRDYRMRMGDCIYNFTAGPDNPKLRTGIHTEENEERDLSGCYALVSKQYYYFGNRPLMLPDTFLPIVEVKKGYRVDANQENVESFVSWLESLDIMPNKAIGDPQLKKQYSLEKELQAICSTRDLREDE